MNKLSFVITAFLCCWAVAGAKTYQLASPNGKLKVSIENDAKSTAFAITHGETPVLNRSALGMSIEDGKTLGAEKCKSSKASKGEKCNALTLNYGKYAVEFRAYDQGVAYRFVTRFADSLTIANEQVEFCLPADCMAYEAPANSHHKTNDLRDQAYCSFENTYQYAKLSNLNRQHLGLSPMLIELAGGKKLLIGDYNVRSYPGMFLLPSKGNVVKGFFPPYPKHEYQGGHNNLQMIVDDWENYIAKTAGAHTFPWKMMLVAEHDADLLTTEVPRLLADAPVVNADWVKPGKVAWDWWNDWNLKGVNFKAGINYNTYLYYIDFAAKHGLEYIVLDEGWYNSKEATILKPIDEIQLPKLIEYANKKGVGIVLWAVFNVMDENLEKICQTYADMGIKGFKVDFMDRDDQTAAEMVERLAACCAKHHLILDLHGIYKPMGLNRTYPNILNYESVFGMEESRWTELKNDMPRYDVTFPYIRMMAGQVDFTPGAMRNGTKEDWRAIYTKPISMGTRCHQAACYVVQDSPFTMLADSPTSYEADESYTQYIAQLPVVFEKTQVVQGEIGKYIVTAREKDGNWYVGAQTNWDERDIQLSLDFLPADAAYKAIILQDGINANHDAEDYRITSQEVSKNTELHLHLASGGGFVIKLIKK